MAERLADTVRFYKLLERLADRVNGPRVLQECDGRMGWPQRGIYFFYESGEPRSGSGAGPRVVRVGTHGLKDGSRSTLWGRLSQHRGSSRSGRGNHRGSVFRLLLGVALARQGDAPLPVSWGLAGSLGKAADSLNMERDTIGKAEASLELRVSEHIGRMPFLWLSVDDAPGPNSTRGVIERNAIALLSGLGWPATDPPSTEWLGHWSDRERVRRSGLWNNNHVDETYDPSFLDTMGALIDASSRME